MGKQRQQSTFDIISVRWVECRRGQKATILLASTFFEVMVIVALAIGTGLGRVLLGQEFELVLPFQMPFLKVLLIQPFILVGFYFLLSKRGHSIKKSQSQS